MGWAALIGFCVLYGMLFAFFAPYLLVAFTVPPLILGALAIWALPESRRPPVRTLDGLLVAFVVCLVGWPNYVALELPGLPWITMARLTGVPLALILVVCLSMSSDFRSTIGDAFNETPLVRTCFLVFLVIQTLSLAFSNAIGFSIDRYFVAQTSWTAVFLASIYVFSRPGRAERMAKILWAMAIFVGVIGVVEWRLERVPWVGHIPSFLRIEDPSVQATLSGIRRLATGKYRVVSTFSTPLGLGEYLALTMPFVVHFAIGAYARALRIAAAVTIPFILFVAFESGSRLGLIGCLLSLFFYGTVWAFLNWRRRPNSLIASALIFGSPFIGILGAASIMFVGTLRHIVWGTGAQAYSDQARQSQLALGLPLILKHPWGYGIARGAEALGFAPNGGFTIDNYYLLVALDYGVIGFIVYSGMFVGAIVYGGKRILASEFVTRESALIVPACIALANFFIIKAVFSEEANHPIAFMILGMLVALLHRSRAAAGASTVLAAPAHRRAIRKLIPEPVAWRVGRRRNPT